MDVLIRFAVPILEGLFFAGMIGSFVVICITTVEDFELLLEKDSPGATDNTVRIKE